VLTLQLLATVRSPLLQPESYIIHHPELDVFVAYHGRSMATFNMQAGCTAG
jgi:hypothetical protein